MSRSSPPPPRRLRVICSAAALALAASLAPVLVAQAAAAGCRVDYSVSAQWSGGFTGNVALTNLGDPVNGWTLNWSFAAGQQVTQAWNSTVTGCQ
ncbi:cellulose binding domain-containing protein [Streptosporangium sp. CA-115845]|uniref:cellulose binding domain-containing protein n=1 Tax=Streptosporangium sp. CA-115845 TaxID=3240071 RepID=UPI003D941A96